MAPTVNYKIYPTPGELASAFAGEFISQIRIAGKKKKYVSIAVSGGSTPKLFFSVLAENYSGAADWKKVKIFWVDERCVPPYDSESNFGMTERNLLSKIEIPSENIFRIHGEDDPLKEAERYSDVIRKQILHKNKVPVLDIIILGMGEDGHTASIFPGDERLFEVSNNCDVAIHPVTGQKRITLTGKVINNARSVFFLVTGSSKSKIVYEIYRNSEVSGMFPASHIRLLNGRITWFLDYEAGKFIV